VLVYAIVKGPKATAGVQLAPWDPGGRRRSCCSPRSSRSSAASQTPFDAVWVSCASRSLVCRPTTALAVRVRRHVRDVSSSPRSYVQEILGYSPLTTGAAFPAGDDRAHARLRRLPAGLLKKRIGVRKTWPSSAATVGRGSGMLVPDQVAGRRQATLAICWSGLIPFQHRLRAGPGPPDGCWPPAPVPGTDSGLASGPL